MEGRNWEEFKEEMLQNNPTLKEEYEIVKMNSKIIDQVINYRKENNLSQDEFAKQIGIKQQMISKFEKGNVDIRLSSFLRIIRAMKKIIKFEDEYIST